MYHVTSSTYCLLLVTSVDCSSPVAANGVVIEPYTSTTEGSVIHYQCGETFVPNTRVKARCGRDGSWSPDPRQHSCQLGMYGAATCIQRSCGQCNMM